MPSKMKKCVNKCKICCHLVKLILSPNIPTYFLWSGLAYIAATITIFILAGSVNKFLCNIFVPREKCKDCTASNLLMCPKAACYQNAMNLTIMEQATDAKAPLLEALVTSSGDWHCLKLTQESADPVKMALKMYEHTTDPKLPQITNDCVTFHCKVLLTALQHPELVANVKSTVATGCANSKGSKQPSDASSCVCSSLYETISPVPAVLTAPATALDFDQGKIEAMCRLKLPTTTTTTTTTSTTTTIAASGASVRLLENIEEEQESRCDGANGCGNLPAVRRLDHVPPTQAPADEKVNDGLPEYTVGPFSPCTCYQACNGGAALAGTMKRRVQCMSAQCKQPVPAVSKPCFCSPCAHCKVQLWLLVVTITCATEGILCLIMWLSIVYMNSVPEANLVSLSWGQTFLGCFVSRIPLLIRLIVIANLGFACFLVFVTFFPKDLLKTFEPDCKAVPALWVLTVVFASLMLLMVVAGVCVKQFKRMDPFLFRPVRETSIAPIRIIAKFIRCLGP